MPLTGFLNSFPVAAVVGLSVLGFTGCSSSSAGTATTGHPSSGVSGTGPSVALGSSYQLGNDPGYVLRIHTGSRPCATLGAAGSVWVADINDNRVTRLDPATGHPTAHVRTAAGPCGMAYGANSIWVEDYAANSVTRILLPSLRTRDYPVGGQPYDVTFAAGAAWTTNYSDGTVTRIDAATGQTKTIRVGSNPIGIAPAGGAVWVANSSSGTVSRIDETSLAVSQLRCGGTPGWTAYDGDTVWVGNASTGQVIRVDAATERVVARVRVGPTPNDGDVFAGSVWIPDKDGTLYRIDEQTNIVSGRFPTGAQDPFVVSGADGRLWVADFGGTDTIALDVSKLPTR